MTNSDGRKTFRGINVLSLFGIGGSIVATVIYLLVTPDEQDQFRELIQYELGINTIDPIYEKFANYKKLYSKYNDKYGYREYQEVDTLYDYRNDILDEYLEERQPLTDYEDGIGKLPVCGDDEITKDQNAKKWCFVKDSQSETVDGLKFTYTGEQIDDIETGVGERLFEDGEKIFAHWVGGKAVGFAYEIDEYGYPFAKAYYDENGRVNGYGEEYWQDSLYQGNILDYERDGFGLEFHHLDKTIYEGYWEEGVKHGKGTEYSHIDKTFYDGDFKNGQWHGQGVWMQEGIGVYKGNFEFGYSHGFGEMVYEDGVSYKGDWYRNLRHGHGRYVDSDGTSYEGNWVMGDLSDDDAVIEYPNKSKYVGGYKNDKKHGSAKIYEVGVGKGQIRNYRFNLLHGKNEFIREDRIEILTYKDGLLDGPQKAIYSDPKEKWEYEAKDGVTHGKLLITYESGKKLICDYNNARRINCKDLE